MADTLTRQMFKSVNSGLDAGQTPIICSSPHRKRVRRLTPRECERLQGFPDDYTAISYRGKPAADTPRYRVLGNSMAVPVVRWIGTRIASVDAKLQKKKAPA